MNTAKLVARRSWALIKRNPVRAQYLIVSAIALGTSFGLNWTGLQVGAVSAFTAAVLGFLTEQNVTSLENPTLPQGAMVTVTTPAGQADTVKIL
jgi:hypothetical protein